MGGRSRGFRLISSVLFAAFALVAMSSRLRAGLTFEGEDAPTLADILGARLSYESVARVKYEVGDGRHWTGADEEYRETGDIYLRKEDAGMIGKIEHHRYSRNDRVGVLVDGNVRDGEFSWLAEQPYDYLPAFRGKITFAAGRLVIEWPAAHPFRRTEFRFSRSQQGIACELTDRLIATENDQAVLNFDGLIYRYRPPKAVVKSQCALRSD